MFPCNAFPSPSRCARGQGSGGGIKHSHRRTRFSLPLSPGGKESAMQRISRQRQVRSIAGDRLTAPAPLARSRRPSSACGGGNMKSFSRAIAPSLLTVPTPERARNDASRRPTRRTLRARCSGGMRSPLGAPPRLSLRRPNATLSSGRLPGHRVKRASPLPGQCSELLTTGHRAGGRVPKPPGSGCETAAGAALAPPQIASSVLARARLLFCN